MLALRAASSSKDGRDLWPVLYPRLWWNVGDRMEVEAGLSTALFEPELYFKCITDP